MTDERPPGPASVAARPVRSADGPLDAVVTVPGSKSIANRALVCAALADGDTLLRRLAPGDDTAAMIDCLGRLGMATEGGAAGDAAGDIELIVHGSGGVLRPGPELLPARLAGTTARFVTGVAALGEGPYTIDGDAPLRARPMAPLHDALRALGASVVAGEQAGRLPVTVARAALSGGQVAMAGDVSSQFVTALMLIAPYLDDGLLIELTSPLVSRPYVTITAQVMAAFGVDEVEVGERLVRVAPGRYRATEYLIEPDASSAGYPLAAAAVVGGQVTVEGLGSASVQGDARFAAVLGEMGCHVTQTATATTVRRDPAGELRGIDIDMAAMSDLVPTLAVVATVAVTPTRITGVGFIRSKESDRLGDLAAELRRTGARVATDDDGLTIEPVAVLHGARLGTHHDHRLAMAFGVLGLHQRGIEVEDPAVVSKSWPSFWDALDALGATAGSGQSE